MFKAVSILLLVVTLALTGTASEVLAQGDGEASDSGIRLVCISGFGCAYTPLTNEDIEIVLPDTPYFVFEDLLDAPPAEGLYNFTYPGAGLVCEGAEFNTQPEDSPGSFEVLDADGEQILAGGISTESVVMDRLGPGLYAGELTLSDAGGTARYTLFTMVTGETTVSGLTLGKITSADGTCDYWATYRGSQ